MRPSIAHAPIALLHLAALSARVAPSIFLALAPAILARERAVKHCLEAIALQKVLIQQLMVGRFCCFRREGRQPWAQSILRATVLMVLLSW